ncbi:MAG: hypothetical protein IPG50_15580 [Myxococcales bacterium]|nr:hypothetical protein [Myxococcales bacterium]
MRLLLGSPLLAFVVSACTVVACGGSTLGAIPDDTSSDAGSIDAELDGPGGDDAADGGARDATLSDASPPDALVLDATVSDATFPDAPTPDATVSDAALAEAGVDATVADGATPDAGTDSGTAIDAAGADSASPDAALPDAGPFAVASLPGLSMWLTASTGIVADPAKAGRVKRWLDQSGNANHAEKRPSENGPLFDPQALNGYDVLEFDADTTGLTVADAASLKFGTGAFALVAVARVQTGDQDWTGLWWKGSPGFIVGFGATPGSFDVSANGLVAKCSFPGGPVAWRVYTLRGPALRLTAGTSTATGSTSTYDLSSGNDWWMILPQNGGSHLATSKLAELIFINGTLSDANLAALVAHLTAKYAL